MTFTGTLIEGLMLTVERAEQRAYSDEPLFAKHLAEPLLIEPLLMEPWFTSMQGATDYEPKFLGVA
jgi:hypothetical protein